MDDLARALNSYNMIRGIKIPCEVVLSATTTAFSIEGGD